MVNSHTTTQNLCGVKNDKALLGFAPSSSALGGRRASPSLRGGNPLKPLLHGLLMLYVFRSHWFCIVTTVFPGGLLLSAAPSSLPDGSFASDLGRFAPAFPSEALVSGGGAAFGPDRSSVVARSVQEGCCLPASRNSRWQIRSFVLGRAFSPSRAPPRSLPVPAALSW